MIGLVKPQGIKVKWREWNEETFREAEKKGKLVLLNLSASWCLWCRIMDETSYSDPDIVESINTRFVPVRVDIDRRPDIAERYNFGGSPTTAFLTPEGEVVTGGTYIPPEKLKTMIRQVIDFYEKNKDKINEKVLALGRIRAEAETASAVLLEPSESIVQDIINMLVDDFDSTYGGFGSQPKLPMCDAVELALAQYQLTKDDVLLYIATKTLDEMRTRNIHDKVEGGFFRYSVTEDWSTLHYEKMLNGNAQLLRNYLHAYQVTGRMEYAETATGIIRYVDSTLSRENGGFYGSQASDEQYYKLSGEERAEASPPPVDKTVYTNWNSLMVSAYLDAYATLGLEDCRNHAVKTLDFLAEKLYRKGIGLYHYFDGKPRVTGLLSDHLFFTRALIDAYQTLGGGAYLELALEVADLMVDSFVDMKNGGVFDILPGADAVGLLKNRRKTITQNGLAAGTFNTLHNLTGNDVYHAVAEVTLSFFTKTYQSYGLHAAAYAMALDRFLNPPVRIVTVGSKSDEKTRKLHTKALSIFEPRRVAELLDTEEDVEKIQMYGLPKATEPAVYALIENIRSPPVKEPDEVIPKLTSFIQR